MKRLPTSPLVARALQVAEKHLGLHQLCARLGVPEIVVQAWRLGDVEMPNAKFLLLVDLLTTLDPQWNDRAASVANLKRILIVDDHPDSADSLGALLALDGHETISVIDPRAALTAAKTLKPQLAMLDLRMPHIDGFELARLIRGEPELKHTCLVAITAETRRDFPVLMRHAGFDAYLRKPVDLFMLRSVIAQYGN